MHARPAVAVTLLLTFPVSVLAQSPHLDLKSVNLTSDEPVRKPFALPVPTLRPNEFQQAAAPVASCADSEARGRTDADAKPMHKGWFWGGVGSGAVFGPFGFAFPAVAASVKPKPKTVPQDVDAACYKQGFGSKARHENALTALWGSAVGFGAWLVFLAVSNQFD